MDPRGAIVDELRAALDAVGPPDLVAAYLFGSVARGAAGPRSDVDVAVLVRSDPPATLEGLRSRLEGELERVLGRSIDLVVLNGAPVDLVHRVLRDSQLLLEPDRQARVRFEVQARAAYFDLVPILRRYRRLPEVPP